MKLLIDFLEFVGQLFFLCFLFYHLGNKSGYNSGYTDGNKEKKKAN